MATTNERYERAAAYAHRAIDSVSGSFWSSGPVDYYANRQKTETARHDLDQIESRWWRASNENERARIARDAELLADRIKENLPGAPQDWTRTNLTTDEMETSTAATSFGAELSSEASHAWAWASHAAGQTVDATSKLGLLALLGGGLYLGAQVVGLLRGRQAQRLIVSLENAANDRKSTR